MYTNIDRSLATNTLRQCDHGVTRLVVLVLEEAVRITLGTTDISVTVYIVFNATFKSWESMNGHPD